MWWGKRSPGATRPSIWTPFAMRSAPFQASPPRGPCSTSKTTMSSTPVTWIESHGSHPYAMRPTHDPGTRGGGPGSLSGSRGRPRASPWCSWVRSSRGQAAERHAGPRHAHLPGRTHHRPGHAGLPPVRAGPPLATAPPSCPARRIYPEPQSCDRPSALARGRGPRRRGHRQPEQVDPPARPARLSWARGGWRRSTPTCMTTSSIPK